MVAVVLDYAKKFIENACGCDVHGKCSCTEASCGCPVYITFHLHAFDCQPESAGGSHNFQKRLDAVKNITEKFFVKGAIINEVGMLICHPLKHHPICLPNSGYYLVSKVRGHSCPANNELPKGLATFIEKMFDHVIEAKTSDGKAIVKGLSWFNSNMDGGPII